MNYGRREFLGLAAAGEDLRQLDFAAIRHLCEKQGAILSHLHLTPRVPMLI